MGSPPADSSGSGPPVALPEAEQQALFRAGMAAHQQGRLEEAARSYRRILQAAPDHADALHFLGLAEHQAGRSDAALTLLARAIELRPDVASFHLNLGGVLEALDRWAEACDSYERALAADPELVDAHFNLGIALLRLGRAPEAAQRFSRVLEREPADVEARLNLGRSLAACGRWADARDAYARAAREAPRMPAALAGLAEAHRALGDRARAEEALRRALTLREGDPALLNNLGNVLRETGRWAEAGACYEAALATRPDDVRIRLNLARAQLALGQVDAALAAVRGALEREPRNAEARRELASALSRLTRGDVSRRGAGGSLRADLEAVLGDAGIDPQPLARCMAAVVLARHWPPRAGDEAPGPPLDALAADPVLLALLSRCLNVDRTLELRLCDVRRRLLTSETLSGPVLELGAAVALQCLGNEYLWPPGEGELERVEALSARAAARASPFPAPSGRAAEFVKLAMYRRPGAEAAGPGLATMPQGASYLAELWRRAVLEPREEAALRDAMPRLGGASEPTSQRVRAQYEHNPYPRWVSRPQPPREPLHASLARRFGARLRRVPAEAGFSQILVAGCGTGFEPALLAAAEPGAHITAVDLSLVSLGYARRKAAELGLDRVRFVQGDLLQVRRLDRQFDLVVSTGVLHHMADPMAGWRALREVLAPDGLMRVALYSERARQVVVAVRRRLEEEGVAWGLDALRDLRRAIFDAPPGDPLHELAESDDLYSVSAARDLLFHVCEHRFSPAQLGSRLEALGLEFLGMELEDPGIAARFGTMFPGEGAAADLQAWDAFEARYPDSFRSMLQLWCQPLP